MLLQFVLQNTGRSAAHQVGCSPILLGSPACPTLGQCQSRVNITLLDPDFLHNDERLPGGIDGECN